MNQQFLVIIFCSFMSFSVSAKAQNTAAVMYIKKHEQLKTLDAKTVDKGYEHLQALVKGVPSAVNHKNVVALTMLLLKRDPSQYAAEVIHDYYLKNKKAMQEALVSLKKEDAAHFEQAMKNYQLLIEKGDG